MRQILRGLALLALAGQAQMAHAGRFRIYANGMVRAVTPNVLQGATFIDGSTMNARWDVDLPGSTPIDLTLGGGSGQARVYSRAVTNGSIFIAGNGAADSYSFDQNGDSFGHILVINDATSVNPIRIDQLTISEQARFSPGFTTGYSRTGGLVPGVFLRSLSFGYSAVGTEAAPPTLVTSVDAPDFAGLLSSRTPNIFSFAIAQGNPNSQLELAMLPTTYFNVSFTSVNIVPLGVPEPASWVLLIGGFMGAGSAARSRRERTVWMT
jgi:hypothetical protein